MSSTRSATNYNSKFFNSNTIEQATKTEPTAFMTGFGDLMDNIRDGRIDTFITLAPDFLDADIQPDGDMDVATGWTATNGASATDAALYIVGTGSVKLTWTNSGSQASASIEKTFSAFSIVGNKLCRFALYMTAANMAVAPLTGLSVTITDNAGSPVTKTVAITADDDSNLFSDTNYMSDAWRYFSADMSGSATIDYAHIVKVKITATVGTGTGTTPFINLDGVRFGPADCEFIYEYDTAFRPSMIAVNGMDCARYDFSASTNGVSYSSLSSSTAFLANNILLFETITAGLLQAYYRLTVSFKNQGGGVGTVISNILILDFFYEWDNQPRCLPARINSIDKSENKHGALTVNKVGSGIRFDLAFDGFTVDQQNDLTFIETLFERKTPLWFWLNGNNTTANYASSSTPWQKESIYYVYDSTEQLPLGHMLGLADTHNPTDTLTVSLVEAAYKRLAA